MLRGLLVAASGAALIIAGLSGCSSGQKSSSESSASSSSSSSSSSSAAASSTTSASGTATAAPGATTVTIDGKPREINGQVVCATMGGNVNIAIGEAATGVAAMVSEDGSKVTSVGLGNVDGVTLAVGPGAGDATATVVGKNYKITGNATGIDMANPMSPVTKPFEIDVTCP